MMMMMVVVVVVVVVVMVMMIMMIMMSRYIVLNLPFITVGPFTQISPSRFGPSISPVSGLIIIMGSAEHIMKNDSLHN